MTNISVQDLLKYFQQRNNRFTNSEGMEMGWSEEWGMWTYLNHFSYDTGPLQLDISTEEDELSDFINGFKLQRIEDIDRLHYTNAWMRYLNGGAEIIITPMELEAALKFKLVRSKTVIFSMDLHFYDEVTEHLTMPEDFEKYISENDRRLFAANENRYKVGRS